jgi:hypothetical protein
MNLHEFYNKLEKINIQDIFLSESDKLSENMLNANRQQLLEGKNINSENITPSYLEDKYFKTRKSANKYAKWKRKITPNKLRSFETPNLFITGKFHRSIQLVRKEKIFYIFSNDSNSNSILSKFKSILGLTLENKKKIGNEIINNSFKSLLNIIKNG